MTHIRRILSRLLGLTNFNKKLRDKNWRLGLERLEDRTVPSTLIRIADADGYVSDADMNGVFDTVNTTDISVQTTSIPATGAGLDQTNTAAGWMMYNMSYAGNLPMGQEFKPTLSTLNYVDLFIEDAGSDIGPGASFQVNIRSGSITGAVVGSAAAFVPDGTNTGGGSTWTHFTFTNMVSLTPGATYVIQVMQTSSGSGTENYMLMSDDTTTDTYTAGRAILGGVAQTSPVDFLFKEGSTGTGGASQRGVMEFATPGITNTSVINSVSFQAQASLYQLGNASSMNISFLVYSGNGVITTADATATIVGSTTMANAGTGVFTVNLDPAMIQSLIRAPGYAGFIGIRMQLNSGQKYYLVSTESSSGTKPTLTIRYDGPTAVNDTFKINQGAAQLNVAAPGVLANDTALPGTTLTASLVVWPTWGTISFPGDGSFVYTPGANFTSTDTFQYRVSDGTNTSSTATVTIRLNHPPVTFNRSYVDLVNQSMNVAYYSGVLSNNYDPDNDPITAVLVTGPTHGNLTLNSDGSFVYTPNAGYIGYDQFTFQASDGSMLSSVGAATIYVDSIPVAQNDSYATDQGVALNVAAPGILANDTDANNDPLTAYLVTNPSHGTLTLNGNGSFVYTPAAGFYGSDSFTYKDSDGYAGSNVATVNISVNHFTRPPVANDDVYSVNEDQTLTLSLTPGVTTLTMQSQPGDYIGQGQNYSYSTSTGVFSAIRNFDNGVSLSYQDSTNANAWWYLDFAAPGNVPLAPGDYLNATRYPFQNSTSPGLNVSGEGRGSNTLTGKFTVLQMVYLPNNQIGRFDATFEQHSEGATPALTGEIRYNYSTAPSGVLINDTDADGDPLSAILVTGPSHGTLALNADGTFTYHPNANYNGTDSFTYKANDGFADSNVATVTINVNPVNDFPVAVNDSYTTDEDTTLSVAAPGVLANDSDVDSPTLTAFLGTGPAHGSLTFNNDGSFVYTPVANYNGNDSFTYFASDGSAPSFLATVNIFVRPVNDTPVANNDSFTINEDTPLVISAPGLLVNDTDVDGDPLQVFGTTLPAHGMLVVLSNGSFTYTPNPNYNGPDSFTYRVRDNSFALSNFATVNLTVNAVNDAPNAAAESYATDEDTPLTVAAPGVLANDTDVEGDPLTAVLVMNPAHGTMMLNSDGSFTYTPAANYTGYDTFAYRANDGKSSGNAATVTLTIRAVNDAPTAADDAFAINEDTPLNVPSPGILANDADVDGDSLTAHLVSGPSHGTLTLNSDGTFNYAPTSNYNGTDSFTYHVNDGALDSNVATVTLTINAVNDAPVAANDAFSTSEDTALTVAAPCVLGNDSDVEGNPLTAVLVSGPAHGAVALNADGSFTYTPTANYNGTDSFTYKLNDGAADSNVAAVSLMITPTNDAPIAANDGFATNEDTPLSVSAPGVLGNDTDVDGDTLTATLVSGPSHGALTFNSDGSFNYTPATNYNGTDSFTYKASDGAADSNFATVTLSIAAVNDAPVAANDGCATNEDTPLNVAAPGILGNDTDVDDDMLTAVLVNGPSHGTLVLNSNGSFTYTPAPNYNGPDSFTYKANDGAADSNVATVSLTIVAVNDAPVANAGPDQTSNENAVVAFNGLASSDIDGDALTYTWTFGDGGTANGATPSHSFSDNGTYTVTLTVSDGQFSSSDTLIVTVNNVAPTASIAGPATGVRGQTRFSTVGVNDPSPVDQASQFTYAINWGDGNTQNVSDLAGKQVGHLYIASGTFTIAVTATDKDGGVSQVAQQIVTISAIEMQGTTLALGGTTANDNIAIKPANATGGLSVTINGANQGTFTPAQLLIFGQSGNDTIQLSTNKIQGITYYVATPAVISGDSGADNIDGRGSSADNLLIGGAGADSVQGGTGDDIVIGGTTDFDANSDALLAILAEWTRSDANYQTRVNHLSGQSGGLNAGNFLTPITVHDDAAIDQLFGQGGTDWFFALYGGATADRVRDAVTGEIIIHL